MEVDRVVAVMSTVTDSSTARSPMFHTPLSTSKSALVADTRSRPLPGRSVSTTPVAGDGPLLVIVTRNVASSPT